MIDSTAKRCLITTVIGFYTMDEISVAKTVLELAKVAKVDGMPQLINWKGDNKCVADADDTMQLFEMYDSRLIDLPLFVAADVKRLPPVDPSAVDVVHLAATGTFITLDTSMTIDQANERLNADVKGDCGIIGLTQNDAALHRWIVACPSSSPSE